MQLSGLQSKFIWIRRKMMSDFDTVFKQFKDNTKPMCELIGCPELVEDFIVDVEINRQTFKSFYEAGKQSRQAEIENLQKRIKELELINFNSELHFDAAKEHIDLLQKRIDDALEKCKTGIRKQGGDYYLELIEGILKGDTK